MKYLLIIAAVFCLPLATSDLVLANIPPEYRLDSGQHEKFKPLKRVLGWQTHYYGPRRGQHKYNESYEEDVILNGKGEETASGTKPTPWKTYSVNFKVFPKGSLLRVTYIYTGKSFVAIAEDTGKAMRASKDGSRTDLFTGTGDKGRVAAKSRGRQPVIIELIQLPEKKGKKVTVATR